MKNAKNMSFAVRDKYGNCWCVSQDDEFTIIVKKDRVVMSKRQMNKVVPSSILLKELKRTAEKNFYSLPILKTKGD
jgi:hypothetical protein